MGWLYVIAAGLLDVAWTTLLKMHGFAKPLFTVVIIAMVFGVLACVHLALKTVPLGTTYSVWMGIGAIGTFTIGVLLFGESLSLMRLLCIGLILAGIIGLKLMENQGPSP